MAGRGDEFPMRRVKQSLRELNVRPSKQRGQNFLIEPAVLDTIIDFGAPAKGESLVEIGPGLGALTERLAGFGLPLTVIEIERSFCADLEARIEGISVICSDVLDVNLSTLGDTVTVFGNLPYKFSTDIVFHLLAHSKSIRRAVLLLQKEFVDRMTAAPGGKIYGRLSIACQLLADVRSGPIIGGTSFHPPTQVDSRLVELVFLPQPRFQIDDLKWFNSVVRVAFSNRRKQLINSLKPLVRGDIVLRDILEHCEVDPSRRPETLSIEEFVRLSEGLKERK